MSYLPFLFLKLIIQARGFRDLGSLVGRRVFGNLVGLTVALTGTAVGIFVGSAVGLFDGLYDAVFITEPGETIFSSNSP